MISLPIGVGLTGARAGGDGPCFAVAGEHTYRPAPPAGLPPLGVSSCERTERGSAALRYPWAAQRDPAAGSKDSAAVGDRRRADDAAAALRRTCIFEGSRRRCTDWRLFFLNSEALQLRLGVEFPLLAFV